MASPLIRSFAAGLGVGGVILLAYVVVDLYMSGHGRGWTPDRGDPWYYHLFTVLLIVGPAVTAILVYRRETRSDQHHS
jgi:hypothetical protein